MNAHSTDVDFYFNLALGMNCLFIGNYLLWAVFPPSHMLAILIIGILTLACLSMVRYIRKTWPVLLFWILCLALTLGTATAAWDARSIWMFHAKRIFVDNSLYSVLDNYAGWSHNDYPKVYPALAATFAKAVGYWNEVFPKAVICFLYMPPLLIACACYVTRTRLCIFVLVVLAMCRAYLCNGYADAALSLYAAATLLLSVYMPNGLKKTTRLHCTLLLWSCLCMLMLIKNEGIVIALLIAGFGVLFEKGLRLKYAAGAVLAAAVYFFSWKLPLILAGVGNDLASHGIVGRIWKRLIDGEAVGAISLALAKQGGLWCGILLTGVFITHAKPREYRLAFCFSITYIAVLFLVYLSSPYPLGWHLDTSVDRTMLAVKLGCFATLLTFSIPERWKGKS